MRRIVLILAMLLTAVTGFTGYKLVFRNGAILELTRRPDLTGKMVQGRTVAGKRVILPVRLLDLEATERINRPVTNKPVPIGEKPGKPAPVPVPASEDGTTGDRKPLIITEETVGKPDRSEQASEAKRDRGSVPVAGVEEESGLENRGPLDDQGHDERYWRQRFAQNRNQLTAVEIRIEQVQLELNRLGSQRLTYYDDDVYRRRIEGKIGQLKKQMEKLKKERDGLRAQKEKLLEEARRSGALPGWYRDYVD